ncbi:MAG: metallophosphoesterase family protein [Promethearchaeota archaeon]
MSYFSNMNSMKKIIWIFFIIILPLIISLVLVWLFNSHGTYGTFRWFSLFRYIIILFLFIIFMGPFIAVLDVLISIWLPSSHTPRRIVWIFYLFSIITPIIFFGFINFSLSHPAGSTDPRLLVCDGIGANRVPNMAVTFWTQQKTKNTFKWGNSSIFNLIEENIFKNHHTFILNDLFPDMQYWYQINNIGVNHTFKTTPVTNDTIKFAVCSDAHFGLSSSDEYITIQLFEQISNPINDIDILFFLGDFVDFGFWDYHWKNGLNAISPYVTKIPFRPLIGNHDTFLGGLKYYLDYFYPEDLPILTGSRLWYRIDVNNIHFFLMDLEWGIEEYNTAQKLWFEEQIATIPKTDWTIVMSHCYYHFEMIQTFESLFLEHDVDLVFSGHSHVIKFVNRSGIIYNEVGTCGSSIGSFSWYDDPYGYTEVEISRDEATLIYRDRFNDSLYQIRVNR